MGDFRESVSRLIIGGQHVGSAWMVTPNIMCTANHCVEECELNAKVELEFQSKSIAGTVIEKNTDLDIALIQVDATAHSIIPLKVIARPIEFPASKPFELHGYPVQDAEFDKSGLTLGGVVRNGRAGTDACHLMQLYLQEGARLGDQESPFGGISGCPVLIRPRDDAEWFVVGVTSHHHKAQDNILYCTPVDVVISKYAHQTKDAKLKSWDALQRVLVIVREEDGFRTNLDADLLKSLWQDGLSGLWCDLHTDDCPALSSAIERIVVQSPFATARPMTDLHFVGAAAWKSRCECCACEWVPVEDSTIKTTLGRYSFVELANEALPLGGKHFADLEQLTSHIRILCNEWALKRLRERVSETFDNPVGELKYRIAPDIVVAMRKLWGEWIRALSEDAETLHHFIGLMLSCDGGVPMSESAAGTGPETIDRCVLRATIFAMALCVALPEQLQIPRGKSPGNLGKDEMSGHSSGIQTMSGLTLTMTAPSHKWKTLFVMLPHLSVPWEAYQVVGSRFDKEVYDKGNLLNQEPAGSLIFPRDAELMKAIEQGLDALRALLSKRYADFQLAQELYVTEAKNFDV